MEQPKEYYAFISYKREDKKEAKRLQHALEYYRLPNHLRQENPELPEYVRPVFRDMTDLEVGELSAQIHSSLEQSHFLIVVCSPRAAASKWVNDEVEYFISLGKQDKIIPYIIEGVPHANNPREECYPPALLNLSREKELLGANINEVGKDSATIRVVSRMFNIRFDTLYQRYQREQKKRHKQFTTAIVLAFLFILGIAGWIWHQNVLLKEREWKMMENQARAVAEKARQLIDEGDSYLARLLVLEILPKDLEHPNRPFITEAETTLRKSILHNNAIFEGHSNWVWCVSYNSIGTKLASASRDNTIRIWDNSTGNCLDTLLGHTEQILSLAYSPDNRYLLSASEDSSVRIWDEVSGECVRTLRHISGVYNARYSPDGNTIVSVTHDGNIHLWNALTGERIRMIEGKYDRSLSFNQDGKHLALISSKSIQIWNLNTIVCEKELLLDALYVNTISYCPSGTQIAFSTDKFICIVDLDSESYVTRIPLENEIVHNVSYSHDGNLILASTGLFDAGKVYVWDVRSGNLIQKLEGHSSGVLWAQFSPDDRHIVSASQDKTIRLWDITTDYSKQTIESGTEWVQTAVYSPDGERIVVALQDQTIRVWDIAAQRWSRILKGHYYPVNSAQYSKDGHYIVSAGRDNTVRIWDEKTCQCIQILEGHSESINSASFSFDGKLVVSASEDGTARIWDSQTGECLHVLQGHTDDVRCASFNPDAKKVLTASSDGTCRIWDSQTGQCKETIMVYEEGVCIALFSPDGKNVAIASDDGIIRFWNLAIKQNILSFDSHQDNIWSMAFSPNGKTIASSDNNTIKIWVIKTGMCLQEMVGHTRRSIYSVSFSPSGHELVSSAGDGTIKIWDFPQLQDLIGKTRNRFNNRQLTPEERRKYYLE